MRETPKAKRAFDDYWQMGPGRSLEKLRRKYVEGTLPAATVHLRTLQKWSATHDWQDRIEAKDRELAEAHDAALRERALNSGYALVHIRVDHLNRIGEKLFGNLERHETPAGFLPAIREWRALLGDIAAEMGGRTQKIEIYDWRSKIVDAIRAGRLEPEAVRTELGDELASELFESAGIRVASR